LVAAFGELRQAMSMAAGESDVDTLTEVFWACAARTGRLRPDHDRERVAALIGRFCGVD